ncbi:MAG TPA: ABC transporter permease [Pseudonocardiaceae bacterium]|nr:ABC transporter permease [Pseudonocardiaceae bacterium]
MVSQSEKAKAKELLLGGKIPGYVTAVLPIVALLVLWQLVGQLHSRNPYAVSLSSTLAAVPAWWQRGMATDLRTSGEEILLGALIALVAGLVVGVLLGRVRVLDLLVGPWVRAFYTIPVIALTPLFVIALGLGIESKVAIIAMVGFFPIAINTAVGTRQLNSTYADIADSFGASRFKRVLRIDTPAALPYVITAIRLAVAPMIVAVFVAELLGGDGGVGYHIQQSAQSLNIASMYAGILVLIVVAVVADGIVRAVENHMLAKRGIS